MIEQGVRARGLTMTRTVDTARRRKMRARLKAECVTKRKREKDRHTPNTMTEHEIRGMKERIDANAEGVGAR
jgi:hypothetical protein